MLKKYRPLVLALEPLDVSIAIAILGVTCAGGAAVLYDALERRGLGQADLVLALLKAGRHAAVEMLIGKPITVCPAQPSPIRHFPLPRKMPEGRRLRVLVRDCPLKIPSARERFEIMRRCSSLESYATRVPRWRAVRDVREWAAAGWLEVGA